MIGEMIPAQVEMGRPERQPTPGHQYGTANSVCPRARGKGRESGRIRSVKNPLIQAELRQAGSPGSGSTPVRSSRHHCSDRCPDLSIRAL
jgi:hypothetical protein